MFNEIDDRDDDSLRTRQEISFQVEILDFFLYDMRSLHNVG